MEASFFVVGGCAVHHPAAGDSAQRLPPLRRPHHSTALTISSTTFLASPKTIMVLSM